MLLSYWGINDVLTQAAVWPHLRVLKQLEGVGKIILITIERGDNEVVEARLKHWGNVTHIPLSENKKGFNLITKIADFIYLPKQLVNICYEEKISSIHAHGAPAGVLACKVFLKSKVPFFVSSFEPHAEYMIESGVWSKLGLKYLFQSYWEKKQQELAVGLMPVAENYKKQLIREGVTPEKIFTVPCSVNAVDFAYDSKVQESFRSKLNWNKTTIGIYVGKYGDLYYDHEAFQIYRKCFELIPEFRLIILTPQPQKNILQQLREYHIDLNKVYLDSVLHEQVPAFLSAADFAFATYKPGLSKKYLSPVKIGEYWANGLPVLLTEGVGDDSDIIKNEGGGALFNLQQEGNLELALLQIQDILKDPAHRQEIPKLAVKYRSPDKIREAYEYFFGSKEADDL